MSLKVAAARQKQMQRSNKLNSELTNKDLKKYAVLDRTTVDLFNKAAESMQLSSRGYMRALRVARTIADLDGYEQIGVDQITEALQYRKIDSIL